jgi:hypothetical protein
MACSAGFTAGLHKTSKPVTHLEWPWPMTVPLLQRAHLPVWIRHWNQLHLWNGHDHACSAQGGGRRGAVMDGRPVSDLLGHSAFTSWNRQGLINSRAQRINYNKSKMISEHLDWHVVKREGVSYWDNPYYWPWQQAHVMRNCQIPWKNSIPLQSKL